MAKKKVKKPTTLAQQKKIKKISKKTTKITIQNKNKQELIKKKTRQQKEDINSSELQIKKQSSKDKQLIDQNQSEEDDASTGYTADQYKKYNEIKMQLRTKTNQQLKDLLILNDQAKGGTKDELIAKVADGMVLGQIPKCPKCFGGKLKFDIALGIYKCPGFQDDTNFTTCNRKFYFNSIQRTEWKTS